jgi:hypothetical protein
MIVCLVTGCSKPRPPIDEYENRVRQLVATSTKGTFELRSLTKDEAVVITDKGQAWIRFSGKVALARDAYSDSWGLLDDGLSFAAYADSPVKKPSGSVGHVIHAFWPKGTTLDVTGRIEWYLADDGWHEGNQTGITPVETSLRPIAYIIRLYKPADVVKEYRTDRPYLTIPPPPDDAITKMVEEAFAKTHDYARADRVHVRKSKPRESLPGVDTTLGSASTVSFEMVADFDAVFDRPMVSTAGGLRPAPKVGDACLRGLNEQYWHLEHYFAAGDRNPCRAVFNIRREAVWDEWTLTNFVYESVNAFDSGKSLRVRTHQEVLGGPSVYTSVEIVDAVWHPSNILSQFSDR